MRSEKAQSKARPEEIWKQEADAEDGCTKETSEKKIQERRLVAGAS